MSFRGLTSAAARRVKLARVRRKALSSLAFRPVEQKQRGVYARYAGSGHRVWLVWIACKSDVRKPVFERSPASYPGELELSPPNTTPYRQLHLVDHGISPVSLNAAITGLKFFFEITLNQPELMARMQPVRVPRTLPVVLSPDEVARLIAAAGNLKHQTALSVAYGAGLRASEVVALKVGDVDSQRMTLRIEQGKGRRDRYAMLSPVLLERLRVWWRVAHAQGRMLEGGWLFPGLDPVDPLSTRQLNRAIHAAAEEAHLGKRVSMHTLRHYVPFRIMSCSRVIARFLGQMDNGG